MKRSIIIAAAVLFSISACKKLQFDDRTSLSMDEALPITPDYYFKLTSGAIQGAFNTTSNSRGVHMSCLADQTTTTNRVDEWWDFCKEPRIRLNNNQSYTGAPTFTVFYTGFYQANLDATVVMNALDTLSSTPDGTGADRKADCLAVAYLAKAIAQGYLGAIYDKGLILDSISNKNPFELPHSYKQMMANALSFFDKAIETASNSATFKFDFVPNMTLTKTTFIQFCNSMAARLMASLPRDKTEAAALGTAYWTKVLDYASKGLTADFTAPYVSGGYVNSLVSQLISNLGDGAGYLPVDIKIPHLADNTGTYPNTYPLNPTGAADPAPVSTDDKRFSKYFRYTTAFGYLRDDRGRDLFSNYRRERWRVGTANSLSVANAISPVFLAEETRLLRAEAKMWLSDFSGAAAELNAASADRKAKGELGDIAPTEAAIRKTLHYEYAISIDAAASVINPWTFMRRNDLLQGGTPTQYPNPDAQMQVIQKNTYTFGGKEYFGEKGSFGEVATAVNTGWKPSK